MSCIKEKIDDKFFTYIKTRDTCKSCPLRGKPVVVVDALYDKGKQCDILFVGINPGKEEAKKNKPFIGPSGQILRDTIRKVNIERGVNPRIAFTNSILCSTNNEKEIPNVEVCLQNCYYLVSKLVKYLNPRVIVPVGKSCAENFRISVTSIFEVTGKAFNDELPRIGEVKIVPIFHPAMLLYQGNERNREKFIWSIRKVYEHAGL